MASRVAAVFHRTVDGRLRASAAASTASAIAASAANPALRRPMHHEDSMKKNELLSTLYLRENAKLSIHEYNL